MANPVRTLRELHYLYIPKPSGRTVAHCLDLDIVTAANDIDEAEKRLDLLVTIHIEAALAVGNYAALNMDAPPKYWKAFNDAFRNGRTRGPKNPLQIRVPEVVPMDQRLSSIDILAATAETAMAA
jgi:hypothetical protein